MLNFTQEPSVTTCDAIFKLIDVIIENNNNLSEAEQKIIRSAQYYPDIKYLQPLLEINNKYTCFFV